MNQYNMTLCSPEQWLTPIAHYELSIVCIVEKIDSIITSLHWYFIHLCNMGVGSVEKKRLALD